MTKLTMQKSKRPFTEFYFKKIFIVVVALYLSGCGRPSLAATTLINESGSTIKSASIEVSGQTFSFNDVQSGQSRDVSFRVYGDSDYKVKILFSSGRTVEKRLGYLTSGMDVHDVLRVNESDITEETDSRKMH